MADDHVSNWRRATLATLTVEELRVILDLAHEHLEHWGRPITPEELAKALRG